MLLAGPRAAGAEPPAAGASSTESVETHWVQVRKLQKRGAYREALQELEIILTLAPGDGRALAFKALCERRLQEQQSFETQTPESLGRLERSLQQEEQAKKRATAQEKAIERQMRQEQQRWDAELKRLKQEEVRHRKTLPKPPVARAPSGPQSRAQPSAPAALTVSPAVPPSAPAPELTASTPTPSAEPPAPSAATETAAAPARAAEPSEPLPAASPAPRASVSPASELSPLVPSPEASVTPEPSPEGGLSETQPSPVQLEPVRVQTAPAVPAASSGVFPGAVEMYADHMTVTPERQLAIAEGHVRVVFPDGLLTCEKVTAFTDTHNFYAEGRVSLRYGPQTFRGDLVAYNGDTHKGRVVRGTVGLAPWYQHGESIEHIAEGVVRVRNGYVTSCDFEPPHYRMEARRALVFQKDKIARGRNVTLLVDQFPVIYLPWMVVADRQTPFFLIPGKRKPWEEFALMGYRYEWPAGQKGTLRWDWRRAFGWGVGIDHRFEGQAMGKGLVKLYFNEEPNIREPKTSLPKGAKQNRYRALFRHRGQLLPDTTVVTDVQKFSDANFRKDFLFRDEFIADDINDSSISMVTSAENYSVRAIMQKRMNRFQSTTDELPEVTLDVRPAQVRGTNLYVESLVDAANLQSKPANSGNDSDVVRVDFFQQLKYAVGLLRPVLVTPRAGVRQTYYTKDIQGDETRPQGKRNLIAGQFSAGTDASLKLFRIFPVSTNALGLHINWLRHVLSPTLSYDYVHEPTVPSSILNFARASGTASALTIGLENKLQTKRQKVVVGQRPGMRPTVESVDLVRFLTSAPYTFRSHGNKEGGRLGDLSFDLEMFPWRWLRMESNWVVPSHFPKQLRDNRITTWNVDMVVVGGEGSEARSAPAIRTPATRDSSEAAEQFGQPLLPEGQWYVGFGHRYSQNDKTDGVLQVDWRPTNKWQIGTFHRVTWKQVAGGAKRFNDVREWQYRLTRDLHDWMAELIYHVDREYGEELYFMLTLKAFPGMPIEAGTSYHQPKAGSQSSPFSPVGG